MAMTYATDVRILFSLGVVTPSVQPLRSWSTTDFLNDHVEGQLKLSVPLAVLLATPFLPWLMRAIWGKQSHLPPQAALPRIERPGFLILSMAVLAQMVLLFLFGEYLPIKIIPPAVAIIAAALALLVVYGTRAEPVEAVFNNAVLAESY